jgi:hypothetical protein
MLDFCTYAKNKANLTEQEVSHLLSVLRVGKITSTRWRTGGEVYATHSPALIKTLGSDGSCLMRQGKMLDNSTFVSVWYPR